MRFVTITNARSGSSHFHRLLNSHPLIKARQEDLRKESTRNVQFLDSLYFAMPESGAFGFKLLYPHAFKGIYDYFKIKDIKVIQLIRRDVLETALWYRESFEGDATGRLGTKLVVRGKVKANIDVVIAKMKRIHKGIAKHRKYADFTIYYKDYTTERGSQLFINPEKRKELLEFLGVDDRPLYSTVNVKNKRLPSSEMVINWKELMEAIDKAGVPLQYSDIANP